MKEIKIKIAKGGKTTIDDKNVSLESAKFTKELANDLGVVKERHVGEIYEENSTGQQINQGY